MCVIADKSSLNYKIHPDNSQEQQQPPQDEEEGRAGKQQQRQTVVVVLSRPPSYRQESLLRPARGTMLDLEVRPERSLGCDQWEFILGK